MPPLVKRIIEIMESSLAPDILDKTQHEIHHQYLSAEKARSLGRAAAIDRWIQKRDQGGLGVLPKLVAKAAGVI